MITIDLNSRIPKYQQIYEQFRDQILDGTYQARTKLPPIRTLADELGISRNTVEAAYMRLSQEGYVTSRTGSGFLVEEPSPDNEKTPPHHEEAVNSFYRRLDQTNIWGGTKDAEIDNDKANGNPKSEEASDDTQIEFDFTYGNLQKGSFPSQLWRRLTNEILSESDITNASIYTNNLGEKNLREHIAQMIRINSGVNCHPSQIILQAGTQSGLGNLLMLFDPLRDVVGLEEPGYDGARSVFENARFRLFPLPIYQDSDSFIDALYTSHAKLVYVTPSNQFPTGKVLQLQTRQRLLKWATTENAYILEDDYCREFRYTTRPLPSLQSMDRHNRVVYMGTLSKSLSPALRLSYLVLPPDLLFEWHKLFGNYYAEVPWLSQAVLTSYIEKGYWNKHLRKNQALNKRKHGILISALNKHMAGRIDIMESSSGLHVLLGVLDGRHQNDLIQSAQAAGVKVYGTNRYWMSAHHPMENYVLVGFSAISESKIEAGIAQLAEAWFG
jgi:GntR family transcriptional regulator/MocR family aminotransferase